MPIQLAGWRFPPEREVALSIGVFDGVHLGHQALLGELVRSARAAGRLAAALTFDPPPRALLHPDPNFRQLATLADRKAALSRLDLDLLLTLAFTPVVAALPAGEFLTLLGGVLNVRELVVGVNFALGRGREGNVESLTAIGHDLGIAVRAVPLHQAGEATISSSRIRAALHDGQVEAAAHWLGRPFALSGVVATGDQRGRTIGFPTANVPLDPHLIWPKLGVYAVRARLPAAGRDGVTHPGVANLGVRPTFDKQTPLLEVHLLDFSGDLYGQPITVEFIARLRDERRFSGLDELKAQIARDADAARHRLT